MPFRRHRILVGLLISLATWVSLAAIGVRWIDAQLLDRTGWAQTSRRLIADRQVRAAISGFSVDQAFHAAGIDAAISRALPPGVAGEAQRRLHGVATGASDALLSSRDGRRAWVRATDQAQSNLLAAVDHPDRGQSVVLDLSPLLSDLVDSVAGSATARLIPGSSQVLAVRSATAGRLVVLHPDQLRGLRVGVRAARTLDWALPVIAVALYVLALLIGDGWRLRVLSRVGYSLVIAGGVALAARTLLRYPLSAVFVTSARDRAAVRAAWMIATNDLETIAVAVLVAGIVVALGSWALRVLVR